MKIGICYFSATGNTVQIARAIGERLEQLGAEVEMKDVTALVPRQEPLSLEGWDAVLFGSPIHSMRAPRVFRDWLSTLEGKGKRCAMFFTYGGFQVHPAHFDTCRRLQARGFVVTASAEFTGAHTFNLGGWQVMMDRPDQAELDLAAQYAEKVLPRLSGQDQAVVPDLDPGPYTEEELDQFEKARIKLADKMPSRRGEECQMCLQCEEVCPTAAMDADSGEVDKDKCILCMACVKICPDQVLAVGDMTPVLQAKMANDKETPESLKAKHGKLYL